MIQIRKAETDEEFHKIAELARIIWQEHFTPIIGAEQVAYMLEQFQSYEAIRRMIREEGYQYYMAFDGESLAGYCGVHPEPEEQRIFLSKAYVEKSFRGRGIGKLLIAQAEQSCPGCDTIWLTVNRHNDNTIAIYKKLGFVVAREQKADIGNGFIMDDYVMEKKLS